MQVDAFNNGWSNDFSHCIFGIGRHVFASALHFECVPANLRTALACSNPDRKIWNVAYDEEYDGLRGLDVVTKIIDKQYRKYTWKYGDVTRAILTMNLFMVKHDI